MAHTQAPRRLLAQTEPPSSSALRGRPLRNHRQVVEGIAYRYRCGIAWRDLPERFGAWQTVWKRYRRFAVDGIWDRIHAVLLSEADSAGEIDWTVSVDSTINRAHQHGTNLPRNTGGRPRITRNSGRSLRTRPSDGPGADWAPRSTTRATGKAGRWRSSLDRARARTRGCSCTSWRHQRPAPW